MLTAMAVRYWADLFRASTLHGRRAKQMFDASKRIRGLDLSLFDAIPSLLGVHRAVMNKHGRFAYLEIGSHLGGSIQPYLLNSASLRIYSIDRRPSSQPDERERDCTVSYPENSTELMLHNLA